jgi:uncharacterized RDD family membrane protein YckC
MAPNDVGPPMIEIDRSHAGLVRRLAALCYDALILFALWLVVTSLVVGLRAGTGIEPETIAFQLLLAATLWLYFCWFWVHGGQTIGMRAWRLRLISPDGSQIGWGRASVRFATAWVSLLPLGLGFWWSIADDNRCWHDRLSGTLLVVEPRRQRGPTS